jgi:nitroimidazol reductase NimA-like FMN-containing flavoprotein (pyridoxamine 5'-phosphate oxidase superfamily)
MPDFPQTKRNLVRRLPARATYDAEAIHAIIDEAPLCHIAFSEEGQPFVIPALHGRLGNELFIHGAPASRLLRHIAAGQPVSAAFTLLDGLVLARSIFHHSMNYRSAIIFGQGRIVEADADKLRALEAISEHLLPGRWAEARPPNRAELNATAVVAIVIESASAKIRSGPPGDDEKDYSLPVWAGILPLAVRMLGPVNDPRLTPETPLPESVIALRSRDP